MACPLGVRKEKKIAEKRGIAAGNWQNRAPTATGSHFSHYYMRFQSSHLHFIHFVGMFDFGEKSIPVL
jgi:hypothetical protein